MKTKFLSCVPEQLFSQADKLEWVEDKIKAHKPDIFITPQEFFGGIQNLYFDTGEPLHYKEDAVIEPMFELAKKYDVGFYFGALIYDDNLHEIRERIYGVDPENGMTGFQDKIHLPAYDHIAARGKMRVTPELNYTNRVKPIEVKGVRAGILFCWEAYSSPVWYHIAQGAPDIVVSMIKFGVAAYPQKAKDPETNESVVTGFGYGGGDDWVERLEMASRHDVCCPIVNSTNAWNLRHRARPLSGTIFPFKHEEDTLAYPLKHEHDLKGKKDELAKAKKEWKAKEKERPKEEQGIIQESIVIDEFDPMVYRYARKNKYQYHDAIGDWPHTDIRERTMYFKVWRNDRKNLGFKEEKWSAPKPEDDVQGKLFT